MLATPELLQEAAQPRIVAELLSQYGKEIPLYRDTKPRAGCGQDLTSPAGLACWPLISKDEIRKNFPYNFLGNGIDLDGLVEQEIIELEHTSGTSEERTALLLPHGWWIEQEARALRLNELVSDVLTRNPGARRATINSPVCSGDIRYHGVPSFTDRIVGNNLFVSLSRYPFLWSDRDLDRMAKEILEWQPEFLDVDPVYGALFASYCHKHSIRLPSLRFIIASYEYVSVVHRSVIQKAFGVPVYDLYGSTETGHLLMENTDGQMRPSLETAFLEVREVDRLGVGDLIVTTLSNPVMPLVRYQIGDLVERYETPYGQRYVLHGRKADAFEVTPAKRITTRQIDDCFRGLTGILHYQLCQQAKAPWLLRFIAEDCGPDQTRLAELDHKLSQLLESGVPVKIQKAEMMVPEGSGKFRLGYPSRSTTKNLYV